MHTAGPIFDKVATPPRLPIPSSDTTKTILLSTSGRVNAGSKVQNLSAAVESPPNSLKIQWDHDLDVYTNDRYFVNGALYVRWHAMPKVIVRGQKPFTYYGDYTTGDTTQTFLDTSPRCDNYHHWADPLPDSVVNKILQGLKEKQTDYQRDDVFLGEILNAEERLANMNNFSVNQIEDGFCYLEYGSLLDQMASVKDGSFDIKLDDKTGTIVTGKYFVGLQNNKNAELSFRQDGAVISFRGKDIKTASEYDMMDFGYYAGAFHDQQILSAAGNEGFTFAFAHHGELPGTATFSITTDIAEGTQVNVYKFDGATNGFTLIAENATVDSKGVVTYKNNTMSEYLITTKIIENAKKSDMANKQSAAQGNPWLLTVIIGFAVVCITVAAWVFMRQINQTKKVQ